MSDSIELYNGLNTINVNNIDILKEPSQQLANAIATGPQDEFFSKLEECNRVFSSQSNIERVLSVTPSWNWRPGTLDMVKEYVARQLMLDKKSGGLGKYVSRSQEMARYKLSWVANKLTECEDIKRMLKREGYSHDVNIEEYIDKLTDFCTKLEESISQAIQATDGKVTFIPYVHIPENNERQAMFYIDCYVNPGELSVCQDSTLIQKIPINGVKIIFYCSLRKMMQYLDKPHARLINVSYKGISDSPVIEGNPYRAIQETFHPYIAMPSRRDMNNNMQWGTTCFSNFTDNIRISFHQLNFVVLAMELLEWAGYYNTSHANPYNSLNTIHFGMPSKFSKAYQSVVSTNSDNCSERLRGKTFDIKARDFSMQQNRDKLELVSYCQEIDCIWRNDCHMFINYSKQLKKMADDDYVCMIESILGVLIESYSEEALWNVLYEDFGCYLESDIKHIRDNILFDYQDALHVLIMNVNNLGSFSYILEEIKYWGEKEEAIEAEAIIAPNEELIKAQMLQWATERSL